MNVLPRVTCFFYTVQSLSYTLLTYLYIFVHTYVYKYIHVLVILGTESNCHGVCFCYKIHCYICKYICTYVLGSEKTYLIEQVSILHYSPMAHWHNYTHIIVMWLFTYIYMYVYGKYYLSPTLSVNDSLVLFPSPKL